MAYFKPAYEKTSLVEKGWVNDPADKGGETYNGIARNYWKDWDGWQIIDFYKQSHTLKRGDVIYNELLDEYIEEFYKDNFWDVNKLNNITDQDIANEVYDTGVNIGPKVASKMLQEALNLLNRNQVDFEDLLVDGDIGLKTLKLVNGFKNKQALLKTLNGLQFCKYVDICRDNPKQERFFNGWLLRV